MTEFDQYLTLKNVEIGGIPNQDVLIENGKIIEIGVNLKGARQFDGRGGTLIPGLIDHHIHLLALAAQKKSLQLESLKTIEQVSQVIRRYADEIDGRSWIRAVGYHESIGGELDRNVLDEIAPHNPVRVQHQTGSLWILNTSALQIVLDSEIPPCVERDGNGIPTGRIWRGDDWLKTKVNQEPPSLHKTSQQLSSYGITGVTDASVTNGASSAEIFQSAIQSGALKQRLTVMSGGKLSANRQSTFSVGPVKILLDEACLPDFEELGKKIRQARNWNRRVAIHCVTEIELVFALAAFEKFGSRKGDRIEHGGIATSNQIGTISKLGLTVVTQPSFVYERGERYLKEIPDNDLPNLYRCKSLIDQKVPVACSSDAPYTDVDPWRSMLTATERKTQRHKNIGVEEKISPSQALSLYMGTSEDPGGAPRKIVPGVEADLCLMKVPMQEVLSHLTQELVAATFVSGQLVYESLS